MQDLFDGSAAFKDAVVQRDPCIAIASDDLIKGSAQTNRESPRLGRGGSRRLTAPEF